MNQSPQPTEAEKAAQREFPYMEIRPSGAVDCIKYNEHQDTARRAFVKGWQKAQQVGGGLEQGKGMTIQDYENVLADHRRLVGELDVIINGEEGAAKQASLCDIVSQLKSRVTDEKEEKLKHLMALVRTGYSHAVLELIDFCKGEELPANVYDKIIEMLNSESKKQFSVELFEKQLAEIQVEKTKSPE